MLKKLFNNLNNIIFPLFSLQDNSVAPFIAAVLSSLIIPASLFNELA